MYKVSINSQRVSKTKVITSHSRESISNNSSKSVKNDDGGHQLFSVMLEEAIADNKHSV